MTYATLFFDSLKHMLGIIIGFIPTFFAVLVILIIGSIAARVLSQLVHRIFKDIHVDKAAHGLGLDGVLSKGGVKRTVSDLLGSLVYWVLMIVVLVTTIKAFGVTMVNETIDSILGYLPSVMSGVTALTLGMIVAHVVSGIVRVVAHNTNIPKPDLVGTLSKYAIVLYAVQMFIDAVGLGALLEGTTFYILFGSLCLALALAFGLGGRDAASKYISKL